MKERKAVTAKMRERYGRASKVEKGRLLDELVALTGYHRWYAVSLLRHPPPPRPRVARRRVRQPVYDAAVAAALRRIWLLLDCICGKRLVAILPATIEALERHGELQLPAELRAKLRQISAASADRLLAPDRRRLQVRGRSGTKPGTLLRHQIPIRTFAEWDQRQPGFVEIDLVGHEGGVSIGDFCQTLDVTDIASGWTETQAVRNKAQVFVVAALQQIRARLPFPLLGIDSDNGSEFINGHLLRYATTEHLTFTRGRAWRKNDGCYVEQKNYSVVRRAVGYARYEGALATRVLNELYATLRLYTNFFQPVMKLQHKERHGAKVKKTYDTPRTPYQRLLESPRLSRNAKQTLRTQYQELNPAALKRTISALQSRLLRLAVRAPTPNHPTITPRPNHPWHRAIVTQKSM
jgi:hypothetical protein